MTKAAADMLAMSVRTFGGPEVIVAERIAIRTPRAGEVLVDVAAAGVGPWDAWIRSGRSVLPQPLPLTLGADVAGRVAAVGDGVRGLDLGMPVYGTTNSRFTDGYAEFAICQAAMIAPKPARLSFIEAASVPVVAVTAWQMLFDHGHLDAGQSVLIHGAAGNVGRFAVQLARDAGVRVVASASENDTDALRALGAAEIVNRELAGDRQVDAALDLVGGETQARLFDLVRPGGVMISAVSPPDTARAAERSIRAEFMLVDVRAEILARLTDRFDTGVVQVLVGSTLPLMQAVTAHRMLDGLLAAAPGKIVLQVE
uniref:NADP-dependent oxidoreductase n=1 Tax=uncultured Sphingomonas sp. TaxID=158754 RepID=UPI0035CA69FE